MATIRHRCVLGEPDEVVEVVGRRHPRLVEDHGRPRLREITGLLGVVEQLGEGHGGAAGLAGEYVGGLARRGEPDHRPALGAELVDAGAGGGGLAGTGRSDDQYEAAVAADRVGGRLLLVLAVGRCGWFDGCGGPVEQAAFLVEDRAGREEPAGDVLG